MNPFSQLFKHLTISIVFSLIGLIIGNMFIPVSVVYMAGTIVSVLMIFMLIIHQNMKNLI